MQLEAEGYVSKPIEPAALVLRIQNLLEKATKVVKILVTDDHTTVRDVIGEAVNEQ